MGVFESSFMDLAALSIGSAVRLQLADQGMLHVLQVISANGGESNWSFQV